MHFAGQKTLCPAGYLSENGKGVTKNGVIRYWSLPVGRRSGTM